MKRASLGVIALLGMSSPALAITNYSPTDFSMLSNDTASTLIKTVGIGADHHAYMPATPLGVLLGFDVGVDVTYIALPSEFQTVLGTVTGQSASQLPSGLPLPKLNIHKGLPWGIDLGFSFMSLSDSGSTVFSSYGGEVKWAFLSGATVPALALRTSFSSNQLYFIKTNTFDVDLLISKNLILIDPYAGVGLQFWSGDLSMPSGVPVPPAGVEHQSSATPRVFGGVMLNLGFVGIAAQADCSTAGITTFGGKFSFGF